jgi:threonine/homoserine/homoserine lactone efflux protein
MLFLLVCLISFLGSVHPGPVNLAVLQTTIGQGKRAGLWLALGGSLPEIAYSSIAAGGLMLLPADGQWLTWLSYAAIPILAGAGLAAFRQKSLEFQPEIKTELTHSVGITAAYPFWKGMVLAGANPQLLPFWSAVWLSLRSAMLVPGGAVNQSSTWTFALGTATGAFALLGLVVWVADRYRNRVIQYVSGRWLNWLTGSLFIGMAGWQAVRLWLNNHP